MHPFLPSAQHPVTLIGFSWGAWLSFILAARYPALVKSLVLIGSGPFEEKYAARIVQTRLSRLSEEEGRQAVRIFAVLDGQNNGDRENDRLLASMGELFSRTDSFDPIEWELDPIMPCHADIYQSCLEGGLAIIITNQCLPSCRFLANNPAAISCIPSERPASVSPS